MIGIEASRALAALAKLAARATQAAIKPKRARDSFFCRPELAATLDAAPSIEGPLRAGRDIAGSPGVDFDAALAEVGL